MEVGKKYVRGEQKNIYTCEVITKSGNYLISWGDYGVHEAIVYKEQSYRYKEYKPPVVHKALVVWYRWNEDKGIYSCTTTEKGLENLKKLDYLVVLNHSEVTFTET